MEKMDMMSMDRVQENIAKIRALFPECVKEVKRDGKVTLAVDFDELKQEMSGMLIDEREERYQMTWPDKRKAKLLANTSISATLRPCKEESVDFDNTQNLYIEGDNLDVLKLLQETYLGKVKMIYIDPPYNTGSDFVYEDDFAQSVEEYVANSGQYDDQGNRLVENKETNGRFHTDWLNMIYPRLMVARDLLSDDGVIFISIDDNEQANLKKICDEVFGESNFATSLIWQKKTGASDAKGIASITEYILVYCNNYKNYEAIFAKNNSSYDLNRYRFTDEYLKTRGPYYTDNLDRGGLSYSDSLNYGIECPDGTITYPNGRLEYVNDGWIWKWSKQKILWARENGFIEFRKTDKKKSGWAVCYKNYLKVDNEGKPIDRAAPYKNLINDVLNADAAATMKNIFDTNNYFNYSKPVQLIQKLLNYVKRNDFTVLDFFSGSATTAHAVMQLNAEDGGHRKFIMVQLPEKCDEKSEAYKAGYKNICEIGKERIRRAGKKIKENINALRPVVDEITDYEKETGQIRVARTWGNGITGRTNYAANATETFIDAKTGQRITHEYEETDPKDHYRFHPEDLDVGFRVLKLDSSNMKDVYYKAEDYAQTMIAGLEDNVKEDRTPLDLLFQVMLDLGQELSAKIEEKTIAGKMVWCVEGNNIIACFDSDINDQVVTEIAKLKPLYAVFRDSSFVSDAAAANCEQIFASISPETSRRVI